ncbi:Chorismate dehydratase [Anatilimnocola aggregata]|uniref:Chorismate dehydratase n=1 Tax=Anatilimnocola aggregata TaxID=2528021 RepID=A0A517YL02_9BACT|nr:menaquinone biosynthesis protein [Anatilimnocola aggregata]QDU30905.1 Chorismate dehydratase [Anatilimnocola aggregata]
MKVGAVSYLNTKPLVYGLTAIESSTREPSTRDFELVFDLPSRLADRLARGELDVALIPSIEFFQNPSYSIISDACIGCRGPVFSVKLFSRVPVGKIRTLALDEGSRTSAALVQILLKERHGISPQLLPLPIGSPWEESPADGILVIGDRAMHPPKSQFAEIWDLGDVWCRWAELPFVFAMWVARPGIEGTDELAAQLSAARDQGLANLPQIAATEAPRYGLTTEQCLVYLRDNLHFYLHDRELCGLRKFHEHAVRLGLAPAGVAVPALAGAARINTGTT